jgi:hypothetical protein
MRLGISEEVCYLGTGKQSRRYSRGGRERELRKKHGRFESESVMDMDAEGRWSGVAGAHLANVREGNTRTTDGDLAAV